MGNCRKFIDQAYNIIIMNRASRCSTAITRQVMTPTTTCILDPENSSKKERQKDFEYLTPRHQCASAQGNRSEIFDRNVLKISKTQLKMESKVPVLNMDAKEEELKNKINKLGLESFMKDIVLGENISDAHFSSKVIHALNKTYIDNGLNLPKRQFKSIFGKRLLKESRRLESPRVEWNPEKELPDAQFKELNTYIPNTMFPCRRDKTNKLLKNRYKKKITSFENTPVEDPVKLFLNSQPYRQSYSLNLLENKKSHPLSYTGSSKNKNKLFFLNQNHQNFSFDKKSPTNGKKSQGQSLVLCSKVKIHV